MAAAIKDEIAVGGDGLFPPRQRWAWSLIDDDHFLQSGEVRFQEEDHRYMYLLDGGLVDNLGLTYIMENTAANAPLGRLAREGRVDRLVLIVVNAGIDPPDELERSAATPSKFTSVVKTASCGMGSTTALMTAVAQYSMGTADPQTKEAYRRCNEVIEGNSLGVDPPAPPAAVAVEDYLIRVNFRRLEDVDDREKFLSLPTSFNLSDQQIDELIAAARQFLFAHPEFKRLIQDLSA